MRVAEPARRGISRVRSPALPIKQSGDSSFSEQAESDNRDRTPRPMQHVRLSNRAIPASMVNSLQMQALNEITLERCPHCGVARPRMSMTSSFSTTGTTGRNQRYWHTYGCSTCGGVILAMTPTNVSDIRKMWPEMLSVSDSVPERAREYLTQALASLHAPAGALMLAASSVDAMLKEKGLKTGSLYSRIDKAADDNLITKDMALWAHEVRLEANDQRHADEGTTLPSREDAERVIEFTQALAQFLFVLPDMVTRGRKGPAETPTPAPSETSLDTGIPGSGA